MRSTALLPMLAALCLPATATFRPAIAGQPATQASRPKLEVELSPRPTDGAMLDGWGVARDNRFLLTMQVLAGPGLSRENLQAMVDATTKEDLPSDEIRELLRSGRAIPRPFLTSMSPKPSLLNRRDISIVTTTMEQAKELALGLIAAHDAWWKKNRRPYLLARVKQAKQELAKVEAEHSEAAKQVAQDQATLKQVRPLSSETLSELTARQLMLDVDLAGLRAKIQAAQKLWEKLDGQKTALRDQLEVIKTTAQVELAELLARQEHLSAILQANERLQKLSHRRGQLRWQKEQLGSEVKTFQQALDSGQFAPLQVVGKATIQMINWKDAGRPGIRPSRPGTGIGSGQPAGRTAPGR